MKSKRLEAEMYNSYFAPQAQQLVKCMDNLGFLEMMLLLIF